MQPSPASPWRQAALAASAAFAIALTLASSVPGLADTDPYSHLRYARQLWESGLSLRGHPFLPFTVLGDSGVEVTLSPSGGPDGVDQDFRRTALGQVAQGARLQGALGMAGVLVGGQGQDAHARVIGPGHQQGMNRVLGSVRPAGDPLGQHLPGRHHVTQIDFDLIHLAIHLGADDGFLIREKCAD